MDLSARLGEDMEFSDHAPQGLSPSKLHAVLSIWLWSGPLAHKVITINIYEGETILNSGFIDAGKSHTLYTAVPVHWPKITGFGSSPEMAVVRALDRLKHYIALDNEIKDDDDKHFVAGG